MTDLVLRLRQEERGAHIFTDILQCGETREEQASRRSRAGGCPGGALVSELPWSEIRQLHSCTTASSPRISSTASPIGDKAIVLAALRTFSSSNGEEEVPPILLEEHLGEAVFLL